VALDALALPTAEELSGVSYDKNWSAAAGRNVDVMNAEVKRNNEKDSDYQSNKKAYQAAVSSFSCKYKILCLTVAEKNRLTESARAAVDYQTRTVAIAKEKYGRGMLSYEEYLTAQDALKRARDDLQSAGLDLFTAYRNYVWATDHGIV
jgi:outer membrane protein TolC